MTPRAGMNAGLASTAHIIVRLKVSYMPHQTEKSTFLTSSRPVISFTPYNAYITAL